MIYNCGKGSLRSGGGKLRTCGTGVTSSSKAEAKLVCGEARLTSDRKLEELRVVFLLTESYTDGNARNFPRYGADNSEVVLTYVKALLDLIGDDHRRNGTVVKIAEVGICGVESPYLSLSLAFKKLVVNVGIVCSRLKELCGNAMCTGGGV
jgi:hypothetical protein